MWIKAETSHSSGYYNTDYYHFDDEKDLEEFKESYRDQMDNNYYWSDKYHGCKFTQIDKPPQEWVEKKKNSVLVKLKDFDKNKRIEKKNLQDKLKFYEDLVKIFRTNGENLRTNSFNSLSGSNG